MTLVTENAKRRYARGHAGLSRFYCATATTLCGKLTTHAYGKSVQACIALIRLHLDGFWPTSCDGLKAKGMRVADQSVGLGV